MNIYLIGFMGSGKSTTGKKLAALLGWQFVDLDSVISGRQHLSVNEIFEKYGEDFFREEETKALNEIAAGNNILVACGGGTPCFSENMAIMKKSGRIVYLKMPVKALADRLATAKKERPLLAATADNEMIPFIEDMLRKRTQWYEKADLIFDAMNDDIKDLADEISGIV